MAHLDRSKRIEFMLGEQKNCFEKACYDLLRPIAATVGDHAKKGHEATINWFEAAFNQVITVAREILEEQNKGSTDD